MSTHDGEGLDPTAELKRFGRIGLILVGAVFGGLVVWAATTEISGAAVATGAIAVDGSTKTVQHPTGGVVVEILVENGQAVDEGDVLVRLDDRAIQSELTSTVADIGYLSVRAARLDAQINGQATFGLPEGVAADSDLSQIIAAETQLLEASSDSHSSQIAQLYSQIEQLENQIAGLHGQSQGAAAQASLLSSQVATLEALTPTTAVTNQLTELRLQLASLESQQTASSSSIAGAQSAISERLLQIGQVNATNQIEAVNELTATRQELTHLVERRQTLENELDRTVLRSPVAGVVHESTVHTIGGVVMSSETLMVVVPQESGLLVDARVGAADIDQVERDGRVLLRLPGLNQRTTPEIWGEVESISPDLSQDQVTGEQFYSVTISVPSAERERLGDIKLLPGMPVEAYVQTGDRTVLAYLLKPLLDQFARAFRED